MFTARNIQRLFTRESASRLQPTVTQFIRDGQPQSLSSQANSNTDDNMEEIVSGSLSEYDETVPETVEAVSSSDVSLSLVSDISSEGGTVSQNSNTSDDVVLQYKFPDLSDYVSPSSLYNFCREDPFQDILNRFPEYFADMFQIPTGKSHTPFQSYIMEQGVKFEDGITTCLREQYEFDMVELKLPKQHPNDPSITNESEYWKTMEAMRQGREIICQAVLYHPQLKIYGHPDYLVRSDVFNRISIHTKYPEHLVNQPSAFGQYHYIVMDAKFHTLALNSTMTHMLNNLGKELYYKIQVYMYSLCLNSIQGVLPEYGYIIGRGFKSVRQEAGVKIHTTSNCAIDRLGTVHIHDINQETKPSKPTIPQIVSAGCQWVRMVRDLEYDYLSLVNWENPDDIIFRPNLTNDLGSYSKLKKELAKLQGELTLFADIGNINRQRFHYEDIYSLNDPRCSIYAIGLNDKSIVNKNLDTRIRHYQDKQNLMPIVSIRRLSREKKLAPHMPSNYDLIRSTIDKPFLSLDIEMVNNIVDNFETIPVSRDHTCVYLIGVSDKDGNYTPFASENLSYGAELQNLVNFLNFLDPYFTNLENAPYVMIWSHAEINFFRKLLDKFEADLTEDQILRINQLISKMVDVCKLFKVENLVIKGTMSNKLKDVAKTLHQLGYIDTEWEEEMSGMDTISEMVEIDRICRQQGLTFSNFPSFESIVRYNKVDCQVVGEIVTWLQTKTRKPIMKRRR